MSIYCVDFDQGQWTEGMDEAKKVVFEIADRFEDRAAQMGGLVLRATYPEGILSSPSSAV